MCTVVAVHSQSIEQVFWSRDDLAVYVPPGMTLTAALPEIRAILNDLRAPMVAELTCWCGEPVTIPTELLEATSGTPTHEQPQADSVPRLRLPWMQR